MGMSSIYVSAGEDILREGEWADAMYFIVSGSVEAAVKSNEDEEGTVGAGGKPSEKRVAIFGDNEFFGERACLATPERRSATVSVCVRRRREHTSYQNSNAQYSPTGESPCIHGDESSFTWVVHEGGGKFSRHAEADCGLFRRTFE